MAQQTVVAASVSSTVNAGVADVPVALLGMRTGKPRSLWSDAWRRLTRNKMAVLGLIIIGFFALVAILAPAIAPFHYNSQYHEFTYRSPAWTSGDWRFILGTDGVGRDELSRLIYGARISMVVGFVPVTLNLLIGGVIGMISGYVGGRTDNLLMRIVDVVYAFPALLFIILMSITFRDTWLGRQMGGLLIMFVALAAVGWESTARLVRGQVLSVKQKEYVEASRCIGATNLRIMSRHIMPNILAPLIVSIAFGVPSAIFAEAALSFLGLGIRPPTASWGNMIQDGFASIYSNPVLIVAPAACVGLVMLAFTFLGDGLRDALDPRMKQ